VVGFIEAMPSVDQSKTNTRRFGHGCRPMPKRAGDCSQRQP
jgi:hypothetical protein